MSALKGDQFIKRMDGVMDEAAWVMSQCSQHNLAFVCHNHHSVNLHCKKSVQEIIDHLGKILNPSGVKIEVLMSPMNPSHSGSFFFSVNGAAYVACGFRKTDEEHELILWGLAIGGTTFAVNTIVSTLCGLGEQRERSVDSFYIGVQEYFTQKIDGNIKLSNMHHGLRTDKNLLDLKTFLYPGLDVGKLIKTYLSSRENILVLFGPPGTGKTSLMKILLRQTAEICKSNYSALYIKDKEVLKQPNFWANLPNLSRNDPAISAEDFDDRGELVLSDEEYIDLEDENVYLILDDLDDELGTRVKGQDNFIVNQLLSFADGLFERNLKIIITTNKPIDDIDSAIIRPGRCLDVLQLKPLRADHAKQIWIEELHMTEEEFKDSWPNVTDDSDISQAALMSEFNRKTALKQVQSYLIDPNISIRRTLLMKK